MAEEQSERRLLNCQKAVFIRDQRKPIAEGWLDNTAAFGERQMQE